MEQLIWKNKLVAAWLFSILNFTAVLLIPDSMAQVIEEVGPALGPLISFYFFLSCLMIWLTLVLKPTQSRWPIIVVGAFFAFVKIQWIANALNGEVIMDLFLTEVWGLVAALMLVWYGWKVPKVEPGNGSV